MGAIPSLDLIQLFG